MVSYHVFVVFTSECESVIILLALPQGPPCASVPEA